MEFTKMHGLGNDYIFVDTDRFPVADPKEAARRWSDRHTGVGSDGLILIGRSEVADFSMRIFNADGSEAMMCGNGARCVAKYVIDHGLYDSRSLTLETPSGIRRAEVLENTPNVSAVVGIEMGKPAFEHPLQLLFPNGPMIEAPIIIDGETIRATFVCMGNPHCVVFINRFSDINLEQLGKKLEHHPCFPELANVNFVICTADGNLQMQTWERGAGHTQACGTGACAATVAAMLTKRIPFGQIKVFMEGGEMQVRWFGEHTPVFLTGVVNTVYEGRLLEE